MDSVESTNEESTKSRAAACRAGLIKDEFIHLFVDKYDVKEPLILRGTAVRTICMDLLLLDSINSLPYDAQIVNIGCGFDCRCLQFKSSKFFEVDFPNVIERKITKISSDERIKLVECDLRCVDMLVDKLLLAGLSFGLPIILFAECCLMYVSRSAVVSLITEISSKSRSAFRVITFDAIKGNDAFGNRMIDNLKLNMPFFNSCISVHDYASAFEPLVLQESFNLAEAENRLPKEDVDRMNKLCPLDEIEEWRLIGSHYIFTVFVKSGT